MIVLGARAICFTPRDEALALLAGLQAVPAADIGICSGCGALEEGFGGVSGCPAWLTEYDLNIGAWIAQCLRLLHEGRHA